MWNHGVSLTIEHSQSVRTVYKKKEPINITEHNLNNML